VTGGTGTCPPTHTVAQGETLFRIALTYGTTAQELASANSIANPDQISVGQVLNIPSCGGTAGTGGTTTGTPATGGRTHVVQQGENLFRIALQYNLLWTTLAAANNISNPNALVPGQVLQIP
jgi:LysM repeat protein